MRSLHGKPARLAAAALGTALLGAGMLSQAGTASAASTENYGQFSMMTVKAAGQVWAKDDTSKTVAQWAWKPGRNGTSEVRWDKAGDWQGKSTHTETYVHKGGWVYLSGFVNKKTGVSYKVRVTSEKIGNAQCGNMKSLASNGGLQHYVKWTVPSAGYCLISVGKITSSKGEVVHFRQQLKWNKPGNCATKYHGTVRCIRQSEVWSDDNGHAMKVTRVRDNYLGKGFGPGLIMNQTKPAAWHADLRYTWRW